MWTARKHQLKYIDPYRRDLKYVTPPAPSAIRQMQQHQLHKDGSLFRHQKYQGNRRLHVHICIKALPEKFSICKPVIDNSDCPITLQAVACEYAYPPNSFPTTLVRNKRRAILLKQQHMHRLVIQNGTIPERSSVCNPVRAVSE